MEGRGSFFILIVIVAILTLTLAVLAGYLFIFANNPHETVKDAGMQNETEKKRPAESELAQKKLYNEKKYFNLKSENGKLSIIQVNVELWYFKKVKGIKSTDEKIALNESKIKQIIGTYFQNMTLEEVRMPETKERSNKELTKMINEYLVSNEKSKEDIIYEVVFEEWFYQ